MKNETVLRGTLAMSLLCCICLLFFFAQGQSEIDDLKITLKSTKDSLAIERDLTDSLQSELFIEKVNSGRHELTRDYFFEKHPTLQLEYENYLSHETE